MKRLIPIWILAVLLIAAVIYLPGISKYLSLKRKEINLGRNISHLEQEIARLKEEERLLKTDLGHLEEVARKELGLVKPSEIVYKVVEEEIVE